MTNKILSGKYEIRREVGRGGMGVIYEALHSALNRTVAIKVLHAQFTKDIAFLDRFQREARAMARLDHKNIIRVFDVLEDQGCHFIVMEYFQGRNLRQILQRKKKLAQRAVLSIAYQVAKALAYAHENGVIHRDIKPANIIINKNGIAKIADFGIAATTDEVSLTVANHIIGTPEYMSLEQSRGENLDGRSDLYSLGMVMYEMLTGQTYYEGIAGVEILKKLAYDEAEFALNFNNDIVPSLQKLIRNLLKKNKDLRIASTSVLIQQIKTSKLELKTEKKKQETRIEKIKREERPLIKTPLCKQDSKTEKQKPPAFFAAAPAKTLKLEEQTTIIAPRMKQSAPTHTPSPSKRWPKQLAALVIIALISIGIASPFLKDKTQKNTHKNQILQLQMAIKTVRAKLVQTHLRSGPNEIRPWAKEAYDKASNLEKKAIKHLEEAEALTDKQSYESAKTTLKNAHFLFNQAHDGFVQAMEIAHGKIVQKEQSRTEKEKRRQKKTEIALAGLKKEREKAKKTRKQQEALLRRELIQLSKEKTKTKKEGLALKKVRDERKRLLKKTTEKRKKRPTKQTPPTQVAAVSPSHGIDSLGAILSRLTAAYEKKDLRTLQNMSAMSKNRAIFLKHIFKNYKTITVSVTDLAIEEEEAEAIISITELRTLRNRKTRAPDHWKDAKLIIPKNQGRWDKVIW